MEQGCPRLTAKRVAMRRAAHQLLDHPKVLDDPIALRIIADQDRSEIRAAPNEFQTRLSRYLRAFLVARSRYAEDELSDAVKLGVRQYVILGAGLDTFAYRNPYPPSLLRIFEVDHPATQQWKRERLAAAEISIPPSLNFTPIDFKRQALAVQLREAGFRTEVPSFFSWLGVTMYLTSDSVMTTLKHVASSMPLSGAVVFDYALPPLSLNPAQHFVFQALAQRVAAVGEPWQTFFDPNPLAAQLQSIGFSRATDIGPEELNTRYFKDRADGLRVGGLARLMKAGLSPRVETGTQLVVSILAPPHGLRPAFVAKRMCQTEPPAPAIAANVRPHRADSSQCIAGHLPLPFRSSARSPRPPSSAGARSANRSGSPSTCGSPCRRAHRLPHRQSSARSTTRAVSAFRST